MIADHESGLDAGDVLDGARTSALARFAADVACLGGNDTLVAAYRAALAHAGAPSDDAWRCFAFALRRFLAGSAPAKDAPRAVVRLRAILLENADLLTSPSR